MSEILFIGDSSFVGSTVHNELSKDNRIHIISPNEKLDITDKKTLQDNIKKSDVVINFAAFTNVKEATIYHDGPAWKLNAEGAKNVAEVCYDNNKYLIHISTDAVFPTTRNSKGPHSENEMTVNDPSVLSPYGYTKLNGEILVQKMAPESSIVRIAYPFGNPAFPQKDYILKLIYSVKNGYQLFSDQQFTPTYIKSLSKFLNKLSTMRPQGIFHWVAKGLATPYDIATYLGKKIEFSSDIQKGSLLKFEEDNGKQPYAMFGGLSTYLTEQELGIKSETWQESIDDFLPELKNHL